MLWATIIIAAAGAPVLADLKQRAGLSVQMRGYVPGSCGASSPGEGASNSEPAAVRLRCSAAVVVSYTRESPEEAPVRVWVTPL